MELGHDHRAEDIAFVSLMYIVVGSTRGPTWLGANLL